MKGDFSRLTFDRAKHYSGVRMQQGRVQLDADWNEQMDILQHYLATEVTDFIGDSGVPADYNKGASFQVQVQEGGKSLQLAPGRYYIAGLLLENEAPFTLPAAGGAPLPTDPGNYVIYLDTWQCHVSPLEDPQVREVALGGPDTAARLKNVWQVCLQKVTAWPDPSNWPPKDRSPLSTGRLSARVKDTGAALDNQLYRVEIHQGGAPDTATWKWSRDNGSVTAEITEISQQTITVRSAGRDRQIGFEPGQWVELSTVVQAQSGAPGFLVPLEGVEGNRFTLSQAPPADTPYTMVRRWDSLGAVLLAASADTWLPLEHQIEVQFEAAKRYNAGDYWVFPTRTIPGDIEWPRDNDENPLLQAPHGVQHHYVPLAHVTLDAGVWTLAADGDLRAKFKALDKGFVSKEGDTITGSLTVQGDLKVDHVPGGSEAGNLTAWGALSFSPSLGRKLILWDSDHEIGVQDTTTYFRSNNLFAWYRQGTYVPYEGNAGEKGTVQMLLQDDGNLQVKGTGSSSFLGKVGIGTPNPENFKLKVEGGDTSLGGQLTVTQATTLQGTLSVGTSAPLASLTTESPPGFTPSAHQLYVKGDVGIEGNLRLTGTIYYGGQGPQGLSGGDIAELYASATHLEPGDVVSLEPQGDTIGRAAAPYDRLLLGVISTAPATVLGAAEGNVFPVALCGRVPCKVVDENGPIYRGDLLTTSSVPGHAMKADLARPDGPPSMRPGTVLGKALGILPAGKGVIEVFVMLR